MYMDVYIIYIHPYIYYIHFTPVNLIGVRGLRKGGRGLYNVSIILIYSIISV